MSIERISLTLAALIIAAQPLAAQPQLDPWERPSESARELELYRRFLESDQRVRDLDRIIDQMDRRRQLQDLADDINTDALIRQWEYEPIHPYRRKGRRYIDPNLCYNLSLCD